MSAHRPRVLVIDDERQIHRFLGPALEASGYEPVRADCGTDGLQCIARRPPDAVILDLGLPDLDGRAVLTRARAFYNGPVLILSARHAEMEKIEMLELGADDYIEKPFAVGELLARLRVAIRHQMTREGAQAVTHAGDLDIDLVKRLVSRNDEPVRLSPHEYDLLAQLVQGAGKVLTHRQLLTAVWGPANAEDVQYLRVCIGHLRQKIEPGVAPPRHIVTVPGVGYRFVAG